LLLERTQLPIVKAVERIGGLQSQYAPSPYVALWSRLEGFSRDQLTQALERRRLVQGTLMRITIHIVSAGDYWPMTEGVRRLRRQSWITQSRHALDSKTMARHARKVAGQLESGALSRAELKELGHSDSVTWNGIGMWLDLVRVPPSGTWERRRADLYGLAETWVEPPQVTEEQGLELLLRRYLGAFGPAALADAATWAGVPASALAPAAERVKPRRFRDEQGNELIDLPRAPLPGAVTPAPVRFLPTWDPTLLAHARRTQILPEEYRPLVFNTKTPQSMSTFLVDGQVAGTWREDKGKVKLESFAPLPRLAKRELEEERKRLETFLTSGI
jgi:Winged helix DNA-binding domain